MKIMDMNNEWQIINEKEWMTNNEWIWMDMNDNEEGLLPVKEKSISSKE